MKIHPAPLARRFVALALFCCSLLISVGECNAAVITPIAVDATSTAPLYDANNLINNSGLSGNLHDGTFTNMWLSGPGQTSAGLIFDLGEVRTIASALIWQYNYSGLPNALNRGTQGLNISVSLDGVTPMFVTGGFLAISPGGLIGPQTMAMPPGTVGRYVHFALNSNFGDPDTIGLSEVKFIVADAATAAPVIGHTGLILLVACLFLIAIRLFEPRSPVRDLES